MYASSSSYTFSTVLCIVTLHATCMRSTYASSSSYTFSTVLCIVTLHATCMHPPPHTHSQKSSVTCYMYASSSSYTLSKVFYVVTSYNEYSRALTCENVCHVSGAKYPPPHMTCTYPPPHMFVMCQDPSIHADLFFILRVALAGAGGGKERRGAARSRGGERQCNGPPKPRAGFRRDLQPPRPDFFLQASWHIYGW